MMFLVGVHVKSGNAIREVCCLNLWPIKTDAVLTKNRHRCDISLKEAVLPWHNDAVMGTART